MKEMVHVAVYNSWKDNRQSLELFKKQLNEMLDGDRVDVREGKELKLEWNPNKCSSSLYH